MKTLTLKDITITKKAEITDNVFEGSITQVEDGETYIEQWQAEGVTKDGQKVVVTWEFNFTKGGERNDNWADWIDWESDMLATIEAA